MREGGWRCVRQSGAIETAVHHGEHGRGHGEAVPTPAMALGRGVVAVVERLKNEAGEEWEGWGWTAVDR